MIKSVTMIILIDSKNNIIRDVDIQINECSGDIINGYFIIPDSVKNEGPVIRNPKRCIFITIEQCPKIYYALIGEFDDISYSVGKMINDNRKYLFTASNLEDTDKELENNLKEYKKNIDSIEIVKNTDMDNTFSK